MKLPATATVAAAAFLLGAGLMLPLAGLSQTPLRPPTAREQDIYSNIELVRANLAQQRARIDALEARLAAQQKTIDATVAEVRAAPKGYTKAFITLGNLSRLPPTDGISYWARY